jgi:hypothetical protein
MCRLLDGSNALVKLRVRSRGVLSLAWESVDLTLSNVPFLCFRGNLTFQTIGHRFVCHVAAHPFWQALPARRVAAMLHGVGATVCNPLKMPPPPAAPLPWSGLLDLKEKE